MIACAPAEFGDARGDGFAQSVEIPGVDGGGDDAAAGGFDELGRLIQILLRRSGIRRACGQLASEVDRDDVGTLGCQPDGMRAALTPRGPGDESNLAVQPALGNHACAPFTRLPPMMSRWISLVPS